MPRQQQVLLAASLFFSLLPFAGYQSGGSRWAMLTEQPVIAAASAAVAVVMWSVYFAGKRRAGLKIAR